MGWPGAGVLTRSRRAGTLGSDEDRPVSDAIAYFLTWTCYGTWLHGDDRGSIDFEHNTYDDPYLERDDRRRGWETALLANPPVVLDVAQRRRVYETIAAHCDIRSWELHAHNVRTNHVHVVVSCGEVAPEKVMGEFKSWCTRRLRESGLVSPQQRMWTQHGSTKYLWKESQLQAAIGYITECQ